MFTAVRSKLVFSPNIRVVWKASDTVIPAAGYTRVLTSVLDGRVGIDGLIVVDLPYEEGTDLLHGAPLPCALSTAPCAVSTAPAPPTRLTTSTGVSRHGSA